MAIECTAQRISIGEATMERHLLRGFIAELEQPSCRIDAGFFDPGRRRDPNLSPEQPRKMPRAQVHSPGQARDIMMPRGIGGDPALDFLKRRSTDRRRMAGAAELHLSARTLEIHHQLAGHFGRDIATEVGHAHPGSTVVVLRPVVRR